MNSHAVLMRMLVILGIVSLLFLAGCGGSTASTVNNPPPPPSGSNPTPTIISVSPKNVAAGGAAFTLTITGTNFVAGQVINGTNVSGSMVTFGGTAQTAMVMSATQLTATIPAAATASASTATVTVTNPAPGGGTSNPVNFTITSGPNPVPTIDSLIPSCVPEGEQALNSFSNGQLLLNGQNFVSNSVVRWNGIDQPTTFASSSQLTAEISASDIAAAGTAAVTVFNPAPGGGSSNTSTFTITTGLVGPHSIAVDPTGKFAYVLNTGCPFGYVSMYTINRTTGALASIGPPVPVPDEGARSVAVDPFGKFAYVASWGRGDTDGSVSGYTINATTGALTSTGTIYGGRAGLCAPWSVVVDPSGKFAYVANEGCPAPTNVSMFTINTTTGGLTSIGTVAAGGRARSVAVDPTGEFAYVASRSNPPGSAGDVSMYTIDAATGALTSIGTIAAGTDPISVVVDPTGKFAYVTNFSNDVSMYTINTTTGALTSIGTTSGGGGAIAIHPSGKFAYVSNSAGSFSVYTINAATGTLTSIGTTGAAGGSIAIHPSGGFAYVTNSGVSMYSIDAATGALTLIGTIGT